MERVFATWRAATLPIVACNGLPNAMGVEWVPNAMALPEIVGTFWKLPRGLARILSVPRRLEPIGDVWGVRVDGADSVVRRAWTFTCNRAGRAANPEADTGEGLKCTLPPVRARPSLG